MSNGLPSRSASQGLPREIRSRWSETPCSRRRSRGLHSARRPVKAVSENDQKLLRIVAIGYVNHLPFACQSFQFPRLIHIPIHENQKFRRFAGLIAAHDNVAREQRQYFFGVIFWLIAAIRKNERKGPGMATSSEDKRLSGLENCGEEQIRAAERCAGAGGVAAQELSWSPASRHREPQKRNTERLR